MGAGGGSGDVYQRHEIEFPAEMSVNTLVEHCHERMDFHSEEQKAALEWRLLDDFNNNGGKISLSKYGIFVDSDTLFQEIVDLLVINVLRFDQNMAIENRANIRATPCQPVIVSGSISWANYEMTITDPFSQRFPYARHSSYSELCHFICVFKPKDIHACVVEDRDVFGGKALVNEFFGHLLTDQPGHSQRLWQQKDQVQKAEQAWEAEAKVREEREDADFPDPAFLEERNEGPTSYDTLSVVPYDQLRKLDNQWLLFANVEHDFSSLAAEEETRMTSKLLGLVDLPTPDEVKERRDEIRRAQAYLQDQTDPMELQVGPLPPTWPGSLDGPDDSRNPKPKTAQRTSQKPKTAKTQVTKEAKDSPPARGPRGHWTRVMVCHRDEAGVAQIQAASSSNIQSPPAQQSQISVPASVLAPSVGSASSNSLTRERLEELNTMHRLDGSASVQLEARIEAYLAGTEDKFSAWAGMLTSAGDNHGEEELEL
jgi:hypothetical protein